MKPLVPILQITFLPSFLLHSFDWAKYSISVWTKTIVRNRRRGLPEIALLCQIFFSSGNDKAIKEEAKRGFTVGGLPFPECLTNGFPVNAFFPRSAPVVQQAWKTCFPQKPSLEVGGCCGGESIHLPQDEAKTWGGCCSKDVSHNEGEYWTIQKMSNKTMLWKAGSIIRLSN